MINEYLSLLKKVQSAHQLDEVPDKRSLEDYLAARQEVVGDKAFAEFAYLQKVAAETWGPEATAHFARVLRDARVSPKQKDKCRWAMAKSMVENLPPNCRPMFLEQIKVSRNGRAVLGRTIWSVDYIQAVIGALTRWFEYCGNRGLEWRPTASSLQRYAMLLVRPEGPEKPVTFTTASSYLRRIVAGLDLVTDGKASTSGCSFVLRDWRERAKSIGPSTKSGSQLIGARVLYGYGFDLIATAKERRTRGISAATLFRNGLLFAVGMALPERARALSWLEFDRTLHLIDGRYVHIELPGEALKLPEARKRNEEYDVIFENPRLAAALHEYRRDFRWLFDDGNALFPSVHGKLGSVSSHQLGQLAANMTERDFGVRVPIHRFRDNVATEASENLLGGIYAAKTLLRHVDCHTTGQHYDHSDGTKAAAEFGICISNRCTNDTGLHL